MKKITIILIYLFSHTSINARDYIFKTKLYENWVLNDVTNIVAFRGKSYSIVAITETNGGFFVSCTLGNDKRLFEIYTTGTSIYLVEYEDQADLNIKRYIEKLREESNKDEEKPKISHERFGNLDIDDMIKVLDQRPDYFYSLTGASFKYQQQILGRTMEILHMSKQYKVSISMDGTHTFANPGGVNDKYKSTGEFDKKRGKVIYDENTINNLAFFIIGEVAKDIYDNNSSPDNGNYIKEIEKRLEIAEIEKTQEAKIKAWKSGNLTNIQWVQILKTEVIDDNNQPQKNSNTQSIQLQSRAILSPQNTLKKDPNFKIK